MSLRMVRLNNDALAALLRGDLPAASAEAGVLLTGHFIDEGATWLWRIRREQIRRDPNCADWIARAVVDEESGLVIGHAGYHGPPDGAGMVEVGYSVDPRYRRMGHGRRMLTELVHRAEATAGVATVRAAVRPDNAGSLAVVAACGFTRVGEQWHEDDGLELLFERSVTNDVSVA
jgi:RimJ/RimL family protein N-acetyltransferase